ncbi:MAG: KpsF/GutQ family sugar-phosphate isomerase [Anaerolineaceae bacterium]|nr:KpsF/GutQ family sugar-phosphate isomerase [Anaerolineaceae bacterium]
MSIALEISEYLQIAQTAMKIESEAIYAASERMNGDITKAVEIILNHPGKVIISGIGKSGIIGQKITASLCSTGTPAVFLHPTEAIHGNLGVYSPGDPSILISKSGSTEELLRLVPVLRQFKSKLIVIVGNLQSVLANEADVVLDGRVDKEADPLGVVPTASSIVALALGDALVSALMYARNFSETDFVRFHPGGQLGRNLFLHVEDVMHRDQNVAWVNLETLLRDVVIQMTSKPLGAACVIDQDNRLLGIITDGDVRRALKQYEDIRLLKAKDVMTVNPIFATPEITLGKAAEMMEHRSSQISVLPVVDLENHTCLGLIRLHDIYRGRG